MTQEEKNLLLRDLSARIPYGVKGIITFNGDKDIYTIKGLFINDLCLSDNECCHVEDFKPYLYPLSSMTEEQEKEEYEICKYYIIGYESKLIDFYHKNHFDYRGLIEKGLAIEAPEGMYN